MRTPRLISHRQPELLPRRVGKLARGQVGACRNEKPLRRPLLMVFIAAMSWE